MKKKMIVMDLDGTLLTIDKKITSKSKEYLYKLKKVGHIIVIATGRVLDSALYVTEGALFADYIISNAGGLIYDKNNNQILFKNIIEKETVEKILSLYNDDINNIEICDEHCYYKYTNQKYEETTFSKVITDKNKLINEIETIHIDIGVNNNIDKIFNYLNNNFNDIRAYIMVDSYTYNNKWLEISTLNISKYSAIKIIEEKENINNEDVIAFGDSPNDIEMIKYCGVGVAMGNAIDGLKEVSDYITTSHNEDGIVSFLEEYL